MYLPDAQSAPVEDEEPRLLEVVRTGEAAQAQTSFWVLFACYKSLVYSTIYSALQNCPTYHGSLRQDAEDVYGLVVLNLWHRLRYGKPLVLKPEKQFRHYALRATTFITRKYLKRMWPGNIVFTAVNDENIPASESLHGDDLSDSELYELQRIFAKDNPLEVSEKVQQALAYLHTRMEQSDGRLGMTVMEELDKLSSRQRDCLTMQYVVHLPTAQIADILGVSQKTVSSHTRAAYHLLQMRLASVWAENGLTLGQIARELNLTLDPDSEVSRDEMALKLIKAGDKSRKRKRTQE